MTEPTSQVPDEELVPEDDSIIGRAFRWSALGLGLVAVVILAFVFLGDDETEVADDSALSQTNQCIERMLHLIQVVTQVDDIQVTCAEPPQ